jgi:hypothetical protein
MNEQGAVPPLPARLDSGLPSTWVERALMAAWGEIQPLPTVIRAQDVVAGEPALIDFTILDLRIGLRVWANAVQAFVSHRLYCADPFAGRLFQDVAEAPLGQMSLDEFVRMLSARYPTILANAPRDDSGPDTAADVAADEAWAAERLGKAPSSARSFGILIGLFCAAIAAIILVMRLAG